MEKTIYKDMKIILRLYYIIVILKFLINYTIYKFI